MREKAAQGEHTFALTADVKAERRQIPCDWHLLGSQVVPGGQVCVNTVGTFGVSSASYYWSQTAGALGRPTQCLETPGARTLHMLVADDYMMEAGGQAYRQALFVFFALCSVLGVPLSWNKTAGGDTIVWMGFELLLRASKVRISQRRADWFVRWSTEVAEKDFFAHVPLR